MRWNDTHKFRVFVKRYNPIYNETKIEVTDENVTILEARERLGKLKETLNKSGLVANGHSSSKGYRKAYFLDNDKFEVVFISYSLMKDRLNNYIPSLEYHVDDLFRV